MKKITFRATSIVLVLSMLLSIVPPNSILATPKEEEKVNHREEKVDYDVPYRGEIEAKRELNEKHFVREDGLIEAVVYDTPVHYINDEGALTEINNALETEETDGVEYFSNKANDFKVKFSKKAKQNKLVTIKKGNAKLSWALDGTSETSNAKKVAKKSEEIVFSKDEELNAKLQKNHRLREVENLSSKVKYDDILENVDLEYEINGQALKENIIVKELDQTDAEDKYIYNFILDLNKLEIKQKDGKITLVHTKTGEEVFAFSDMFMTDAKEDYSDKVDVSVITEDEDGKELKNPILQVNADDEWIESEDRELPIKIDPVVTGSTTSAIKDTYISQLYPNTNLDWYGKVLVGIIKVICI